MSVQEQERHDVPTYHELETRIIKADSGECEQHLRHKRLRRLRCATTMGKRRRKGLGERRASGARDSISLVDPLSRSHSRYTHSSQSRRRCVYLSPTAITPSVSHYGSSARLGAGSCWRDVDDPLATQRARRVGQYISRVCACIVVCISRMRYTSEIHGIGRHSSPNTRSFISCRRDESPGTNSQVGMRCVLGY